MVPEHIFEAVDPIFRGHGVPTYIWQSIAAMETGGTFDPGALGDYRNGQPLSFGLFQLYTAGGQGDPWAHNPSVLLDPATNAAIAAPAIAEAYRKGLAQGVPEGPDLAAFVAAHSGHPNNLPAGRPAVERVKEWASIFFTPTSGQIVLPPGPGGIFLPPPDEDSALPGLVGTPGGGGVAPASPGSAVISTPAAPGDGPPVFSGDWWKMAGLYVAMFLIGLLLLAGGIYSMMRGEGGQGTQ